jgi:hypothetical protein
VHGEGGLGGVVGQFPDVVARGRIALRMKAPYALKEWASARKESPLETKLRAMPPGERPGSVLHPFPVVARADYLAKIRGKGIFKRAEGVEPQKVPLSGLTAIQKSVNVEKLAQHVENPNLVGKGTRAPGHGGIVDQILVVKVGGKSYIHDGTHRTTSAHLRGQTHVLARVIDLDSDDKSPISNR